MHACMHPSMRAIGTPHHPLSSPFVQCLFVLYSTLLYFSVLYVLYYTDTILHYTALYYYVVRPAPKTIPSHLKIADQVVFDTALII